MNTQSAIEWTETTWNPLVGCTRVSAGCQHCYAETMAKRLGAMAQADIDAGRNPGKKRHYLNVLDKHGRWNGTVNLVPEALTEPLRWKKPRRVFVNSMSDLFHESVPYEFIDKVFAVMAMAPQHTFQVLTKRPDLMARYMGSTAGRGAWNRTRGIEYGHGELIEGTGRCQPWPLRNVWLGTSVENPETTKRINDLQKCPAVVRFISAEPLLGPLDFFYGPQDWGLLTDIHWVIVGGESGHGARPCNVAWIRSIIDQCKAASVPVFVKQLGAEPGFDPKSESGSYHHSRDGLCIVKLNDKKGGDWSEWPEALRVREYPTA